MRELGLTDWSIFIGYLVVVFSMAVWCARGQQTNEDYFIGGRKMNWSLVGISMFATSFSSISFLGLPQRGAYQDFSFYLTLLFIPIVITPILWWLFVPLYVRLKVSSGYEYLGRRFGLSLQRTGSILYSVYAIGWMGTMLYAMGLTLQTALGLSESHYLWTIVGIGVFATIYTVLGGLKAVIWTDVLQAVVLGGAVVSVLFIAIGRIEGGWSAFWEVSRDHGKFTMFHLEADLLSPKNFTESNSVFTAAAFGLFMYLPGYAVSQNMIQRYVCAGSVAAGRGVITLSAIINVGLGFLFMLVGTALFVFYIQPTGPGMPLAGVEIGKEDQILPHFVATQVPGFGLMGLILAGLFAAAMSTIDSGINGVTSVIVFDWLSGRRISLIQSRSLTVILGAAVICAALVVPMIGDNVIEIIMTLAGTCLGMLLAVFLLGMLNPRANLPGVYAGLIVSLALLLIVWTATDIPNWWYGAFTIFPTLMVGSLASYLFPPPNPSALERTLFPQTIER